jgi:hypothetical protein
MVNKEELEQVVEPLEAEFLEKVFMKTSVGFEPHYLIKQVYARIYSPTTVSQHHRVLREAL